MGDTQDNAHLNGNRFDGASADSPVTRLTQGNSSPPLYPSQASSDGSVNQLWQTLKNFQTQIVVIVCPVIGYFLFLNGIEDCTKKSDPNQNNQTAWLDANDVACQEPSMPVDASKCAYVLFLMAVFWTLQAAPLAITSLLPVILFPLLNVGKVPLKYPKSYTPEMKLDCPAFKVAVAGRVSECYMKELQFLFIGGLIVALAIEEWNIHKRLALYVLSKSGAEPTKLMAGFMLITAFLSMWISNTATTALMIPIAAAVHAQLFPTDDDTDSHAMQPTIQGGQRLTVPGRRASVESRTDVTGTACTLVSPINSRTNLVKSQTSNLGEPHHIPVTNSIVHMEPDIEKINAAAAHRYRRSKMVGKALIISIAYGANIGGIGTTIGTPTNIILLSQGSTFDRIKDIEFITWMVYALPLVAVCLVVCWAVLVITFMGLGDLKKTFKNNPDDAQVSAQFQDQLHAMGKMNYGAKVVAGYFVVTAVLWMTRNLGGSGWRHMLNMPEAKDSTAAIFVSFLLFVTPQKPNLTKWLFGGRRGPPPKPAASLIEWKKVQKMLAWDVVLLLGGGFALAMMCEATGLSKVIGDMIDQLVKEMGDQMCILIATAGISITTGFTSNVSTAQVFLPILGNLAVSRGMDTDKIMVPAAIACSFAFILPISTAPNAIAFSTGKLVTTDMLKAGSIVNILLVVITWAWNMTGILNVFSKSAQLDTTTTAATMLAINSTMGG